MRPNPNKSTTFPENPDPVQSNLWMDPIHVQLCIRDVSALEVSRNRAIQIDIYLLIYLLGKF